MPQIPSGVVTFLFTDIEGSTKLWERLPAATAAAVARHDALLRAAIEARRGYVFKTVGDAFCAAFADPADAAAAAVASQQALAAEDWGAVGAIRARMALHTGMAEERAADYFGPAVNRVARLLSAGYGEQVLVSRTVAEQVRSRLPPGARLDDLGEHRLKDLLHAEHIFQLVVPGITAAFPPIKTLDRQRHNLPAQPTSLVGREDEVTVVRELLEGGNARLVTLTGPGGVGKTRLGLQVAAEAVELFADGVWFVPLAPLDDHDLVVSQIGAAIGVRESGDESLLDRLKEELANKEMLLLLDNFEHVAAAAAVIGDLLAACPKLKLIVTSRAVLRVYGEREVPVSPLGLPNLKRLPSVAELEHIGSVRLFVDRAQAAKYDFGLVEANARAVAEICVRLDGLPLAIELAAARVKLLPPPALLGRLESRLKLLTGGGVDRDPRQQTLRGAIAWSHDLLAPEEQVLFRRLAVFAGGCTFEAAETIANFDGDLGIDVFDGLSSLVDKSLLRQEETEGGEPRFFMLETLREFGLERLAESGEEDDVRQRHANFFAQLAEEAKPAIDGSEPERALDVLETEHDNLRAALGWAMRANADLAMQLSGALWPFWELRGHVSEGRDWLQQTVSLLDPGRVPEARRIAVLRGAVQLSLIQNDHETLRKLAGEMLRLSRSTGDNHGAAFALNKLGWVAAAQGNYEQARPMYSESLSLYRNVGDPLGECAALMNLGAAEFLQGNFKAAASLYEQSLVLARGAGTKDYVLMALGNLADALRHAGEHDCALTIYEEALPLSEELGVKHALAQVLLGLGMIAVERHELSYAFTCLSRCMAILQELGDQEATSVCLDGFAHFALAAERSDDAARLFGAAVRVRDRIGIPLQPAYQRDHERHFAELRAKLGDERFAAQISDGESMTLESAIELTARVWGEPAETWALVVR